MKFLDSIKIKSIKKLHVQNEQRSVHIKKPEQFSKILVVAQAENNELIKQVELKFINAEVNGLFQRRNKNDESSQFRFSVHPSDFNFTATIKNDKLKKLLQTKFDLIVDLSSKSELLTEIVQCLNSDLSIGILGQEAEKCCDLFFEFGKNEKEFIEHCAKQLNLLAKK